MTLAGQLPDGGSLSRAAYPRFPGPVQPGGTSGTPPAALLSDSTASSSGVQGLATLATNFTGLFDTQGFEPPDTQVAVGPSDMIEMVNTRAQIYSKTGVGGSGGSLRAFFLVPAGNERESDPKVMYDAISGRFFATYVSFHNAANGPGALHVAVSTTSSASGSWLVYQFNTTYVTDFPGLGVSDDKVVVSFNGFSLPIATSTFIGEQTFVLEKADLLAGAAVRNVATALATGNFAIRPAQNMTSSTAIWMAERATASATQLKVWRVTGTPAAANTSRALVATLTMSAQNSPLAASVPGGSVDAGDYRLTDAAWRNGRLWTAASNSCSWPSDVPRSCLHLLEVDTPSLGLVQDMNFGAAGFDFMFPAVRTDGAGNLHVAFSESSATTQPHARITGRLAADPLNTMNGSTQIKAGETNYNGTRWGDYSSVAIDPSNPALAWFAAEYSRTNAGATLQWGTWIASAAYPAAGPATKLAFSGQPGSGIVGAALSPLAVQVQDSLSGLVSGDNSTVVALTKTSGLGILTCAAVTAISGVAAFPNCSVSAAGTYVLHAASTPAFTPADTGSFAVVAAPSKLGFTQQASSGAAGVVLATQPIVAVQDSGSATVTGDNTTQVTLGLAPGPALANALQASRNTGGSLSPLPGMLVPLEATPKDAFTKVGVPAGPGLAAGAVNTAAFTVSYTGFSAQAQAAFQAAVDVWSQLVVSPVPILINAAWEPAGSPSNLGSAGPYSSYRDFPGAPQAGTWYPLALANALQGSDLDPAHADITASFNSTRSDWYFGTDGNTPAGKYDLMSVVLHEIGHGLGFLGSMAYTGATGSWGGGTGFPYGYDKSTVNGSDQQLISAFANPSVALGSQLTSANVYFSGANAVAGNGGVKPKLYAPATWSGGSSISHLDEVSFAAGSLNSLMTPQLASAESIHSPGPVALGVLKDIGWTLAAGGGGGGGLSCTGGLTKTVANGLASFAGCSISGPGSYVLHATSNPALTAADSSPFLIVGPATQLAFTQQPSSGTAGAPLPTQPIIAVRDALGSILTTDTTTQVTLALSGPGVLTCGSGLTKTVQLGVASFTGCTVSAAGSYTLQATSSPALTPAVGQVFVVAPSVGEHELSAVAVGGEVAVFGRTPSSQLWYRETSGGTFGAWTLLGTNVASRPEALMLGADTLVFFRASDNALKYYRRTGGSWGGLQDLGGVMAGNPVASVDGDGDLLVTVLNGAGETFAIRLSGGLWSPFTPLGGVLAGQLELTNYNGGLYLFGLNGAGVPWTNQWSKSSNSWGLWTPLDGVLKSAPSAAVFGGDLYLFGANQAGNLWYRALSSGTWGPWTPLDGVLQGSPDVAATSAGLFVLGTNPGGVLWDRVRTGSWTGWEALDGLLAAAPELAPVGDQVYAFGVNPAGNLWYRLYNGASWGTWLNLDGILAVE